MRLGRLGRGEAIASVSAFVLFVATFLDWYDVEAPPRLDLSRLGLFDTGGSAWQSFEVAPWLIVLVVVLTLGAAALVVRGSTWEPAIAPSAVVAVAGGAAALATLFRILFPPDFGPAGVPLVVSVDFGAYLALAASLGIAYGGYRGMGEHGTSFAKIADSLSGSGAKQMRRREPAPRFREKRASKTQRPSSSG
ncbi:MAG TPA: hypothetical protein VMT37_09490 [Solirubrobacterales bacterium]|nr:hypothetical protein [Solirubrobacterales bacterium]